MLCLAWEQEMLISGSYDKSIVLWDLRGESGHIYLRCIHFLFLIVDNVNMQTFKSKIMNLLNAGDHTTHK